MCWRWLQVLPLGLLGLALLGCRPSDKVILSDKDNPYVSLGNDYNRKLAYDDAIRTFEKALEVNPQSVRAHYELGLLYDRHKRDYVTALYHYNRVLSLQPDDWPADNVRTLVQGCRQEFVKDEVMGPIAIDLQQKIEALQKENENLRQEISGLKRPAEVDPRATVRETTPSSPARNPTAPSSPTSPAPTTRTEVARVGPPPYIPSVLPSRGTYTSHRVRAGETMAAISRRYNVSLNDLMRANPRINPRTMPVGTEVRVPRP